MKDKPYLNDIQGWMIDEELEWLYTQAKAMPFIAEIGCWKGRSTHALLAGCPGTVYAVDTWKGSINELDTDHKEATEHDIYPIFTENMKPFSHVVPIRMDSMQASRIVPQVDMVFIDACHLYDYVLADLAAWGPKATRLLCGHDCTMDDVHNALHDANIKY